MVHWSNSDPGAGTSGGVSASHNTLVSYASKLNDAKDWAVDAVNLATDTTWNGEGSGAWRGTLRAMIDGMPDIHDVYTNACTALDTYASTMTSIQSQAAHYKQELKDAAKLLHNIPFIRAPWDVQGIADDTIHKFQAAQKEADAIAGLLALAQQRQAADDTVVAALSKALPASWKSQRQALEAVGITKASQATPAEIAAAMVALAQTLSTVAWSDDDNRLLELMNMYGDDAAVMDEFYQQLGGAGTVDLIDRLGYAAGPGSDPAVLELAQKVRTGLSVASRDWTDEVASQFANDMLNGDAAHTDYMTEQDHTAYVYNRAQAIGYLFSDPDGAPMGRTLTVNMADDVYQWEHVDGHGSLENYKPLTDSTASRLYALENPGDDWSVADGYYGGGGSSDTVTGSGVAGNDASGRILETLGRYPDDALAYLTNADGTPNDEKIQYWFGDRDWSGSDKFEGPSALWLGIQNADGGSFDTTPDPAVREAIAGISSDVMWDLYGNKSFLTENISESASGDLALAIAPNLDTIVDSMLSSGWQDPKGPGVGDGNPFGTIGTVPTPILSDDVLANFLGAIGSHVEGASVLQGTITSYQQYYTDLGAQDPAYAGDALNRMVWLQGALDGSGSAATLDAAVRHDARVDAEIDALIGLVGLIPVPGVSEAVGAGTAVLLDVLKDAAIDGALDLGGEAWKDTLHQVDEVTAKLADQEAADTLAAELKTAHLLQNALGIDVVGPIPGMTSNETAEHYAGRLDDWWVDMADRVQAEHPTDGVVIDQLQRLYLDARDASHERV